MNRKIRTSRSRVQIITFELTSVLRQRSLDSAFAVAACSDVSKKTRISMLTDILLKHKPRRWVNKLDYASIRRLNNLAQNLEDRGGY